jgi:predicted Ser/Thr protein kinase
MPDQIIAARYKVVRELGRGGMGVVYLVEHMRTGDQLALKLLHGQGARNEQVIERFKREARASARIKSEHIVKVVDADVAPELEGAPFLVMELLNGTDLQKQLEKSGRMPPDQAIHYLGQAARALDKSHQMGIIHRDLKPENLFIHHREDGTTVLKILDFGISKVVAGDGGNDMTGAGMTSTGAVMGTPLYMSPEQARGRVGEIGATTDVWAMGLISLQLLSGEIYWRANTVAELMVQILSDPLYVPSERWTWMPKAIDAWFTRSCARDPRARFQTVGEQIQALGAAMGIRSAAGLPEGAPAAAESGPSLPTGPGGQPIAGVQTTTGAIAREPTDGASVPKSRAPIFVGAAVVLLGAMGATAWAVRPHGSAASASGDPSAMASASAVAGIALVAPPVASPVPPPAASSVAAAPPPVPATPVAVAVVEAGAPVAAATPQHQAKQQQHTAAAVVHPAAVAPPAALAPAPPAPAPAAPQSHAFNPAAP